MTNSEARKRKEEMEGNTMRIDSTLKRVETIDSLTVRTLRADLEAALLESQKRAFQSNQTDSPLHQQHLGIVTGLQKALKILETHRL